MSDQWKLVPIEPTDEMLAAARPAYSSNIQASNEANREKYQRMLAAAPTQGADARPVAIYQVIAGYGIDIYRDCSQEEYERAGENNPFRRIVYATRDAALKDANCARGAALPHHEIAYALHVASGRTKSIVVCHAIVNAALATRDAEASDSPEFRAAVTDLVSDMLTAWIADLPISACGEISARANALLQGRDAGEMREKP